MHLRTRLLLTGVISFALFQQAASAQDKLWEELSDAGRKALGPSRFVEAEKYYMAALRQAEKFGDQYTHYAISLHNLGFAYTIARAIRRGGKTAATLTGHSGAESGTGPQRRRGGAQ